ncbi:MAG: GAF domain-containing protein [Chloroflexi bacterium]|nr:GAF domain-containing protein [Chloroflexota bacterium]
MIGGTTGDSRSRITQDVTQDAEWRPNPHLPLTRAELALPLQVRGHIIGALTVQSAEAHAFSAELISILQTICDQLAIAIENSRLLASAEERVQRQRILNQISAQLHNTSDIDEIVRIGLQALSEQVNGRSVHLALGKPATQAAQPGQIESRRITHPERDDSPLTALWQRRQSEIQAGMAAAFIAHAADNRDKLKESEQGPAIASHLYTLTQEYCEDQASPQTVAAQAQTLAKEGLALSVASHMLQAASRQIPPEELSHLPPQFLSKLHEFQIIFLEKLAEAREILRASLPGRSPNRFAAGALPAN